MKYYTLDLYDYTIAPLSQKALKEWDAECKEEGMKGFTDPRAHRAIKKSGNITVYAGEESLVLAIK